MLCELHRPWHTVTPFLPLSGPIYDTSIVLIRLHRASTATIVRIPYLNTLQDKADFLYATTNVGILSTCEVGIGIAASAAATLRPLFVRFLGRSEVGSDTYELSRSRRWPKSRSPSGDMREYDYSPILTNANSIGVTPVRTVESHPKAVFRRTLSSIAIKPTANLQKKAAQRNWDTNVPDDASSHESILPSSEHLESGHIGILFMGNVNAF